MDEPTASPGSPFLARTVAELTGPARAYLDANRDAMVAKSGGVVTRAALSVAWPIILRLVPHFLELLLWIGSLWAKRMLGEFTPIAFSEVSDSAPSDLKAMFPPPEATEPANRDPNRPYPGGIY